MKTIQVLERAFSLLEHLSPDHRVTLDALTAATGINKGTLCNILRTMVASGYVDKAGTGSYCLSAKFVRLAEPFSRERIITELCERYARVLAGDTMESGVVSTLRGCHVHIIAQAQFERALMLNPRAVYRDLSLYGSVSGRVLVSFLSDSERVQLASAAGLPGEEWDGIDTIGGLHEASAAIRKAKMCIRLNRRMEIKAFAVPAFDQQGNICASLGVTMPIFRMDERMDEQVIKALSGSAAKMEKGLKNDGLSHRDFIRIDAISGN